MLERQLGISEHKSYKGKERDHNTLALSDQYLGKCAIDIENFKNLPIDKQQKHYCYQITYQDCKSKRKKTSGQYR